MPIKLSKAEQVRIQLTKEKPRLIDLHKDIVAVIERKSLDGEIVRVVLVLDASGSMSAQYNSGRVQKVLDRMTPIALNFDDNGELECWAYASGNCKFVTVTLQNLDDFVAQAMRGTLPLESDAPAAPPAPVDAKPAPKKKGWFGRLFGGSDSDQPAQPAARRSGYGNYGAGIVPGLGYDNNEPPVMRAILEECKSTTTYPTLVIFITDGGIDKSAAIKQVLIDAAHFPIFWQFVGLGGSNYGILEDFNTMGGRHVDNANFFALDDIDSISVKQLYERLLNEFPDWLATVRKMGMLPPAAPKA